MNDRENTMAKEFISNTFYRVICLAAILITMIVGGIVAHTSVKAYAEQNRSSIIHQEECNNKQDIRIEKNSESDKKVLELLNELKTQNVLVMYRLGIEQPQKKGK